MRRISRVLLIGIVLVGTLVATIAPPDQASAAACRIEDPDTAFAEEVALSPNHARVWRLYQAFFLRQPDRAGFNYWARVRSGGASLGDIAFQFASGPEFVNRYGNLSHADFVRLAYTNVLCRPNDPRGHAYWTNLLQSGAITRWDMMINFVELREYLRKTGTCHSTYPTESASVTGCPEANLVPLGSASLATHGYRAKNVNYRGGSFSGVEVVLSRGVFSTGSERCSVASINGNWLVVSQKDRPDPGVLGIGVVDGAHVRNSSDRTDRGVFGLRFDNAPASVVEVWPGDTLSPDDIRLNSVMYRQGPGVLESWHASAETSPYLQVLAPQQKVAASEWVWAAAGIPLIIDGQRDADLESDFARDPYTYDPGAGHPFVAVDQNAGRAVFGATRGLHVRDLVNWASSAGYEDLIKFDGGGSVEFNVAGRATVAGTPRDIPVWLGIGC